MSILTLSLKGLYFDQIKSGDKLEEFRLVNNYWYKCLEGCTYKSIILTKGYPPRGDAVRRLERPWFGFCKITITHEHFGPHRFEVFAIKINWPKQANVQIITTID